MTFRIIPTIAAIKNPFGFRKQLLRNFFRVVARDVKLNDTHVLDIANQMYMQAWTKCAKNTYRYRHTRTDAMGRSASNRYRTTSTPATTDGDLTCLICSSFLFFFGDPYIGLAHHGQSLTENYPVVGLIRYSNDSSPPYMLIRLPVGPCVECIRGTKYRKNTRYTTSCIHRNSCVSD